jgi:N-acetylmuramoyl-L-alanine amidase
VPRQPSQNATPVARPGPTRDRPQALPQPPIPLARPQDVPAETLEVLARTLWGEARGEGQLGMKAVACVICNRARNPGWWGHDIRSVCLAPSQFSCWNAGNPNLPKLKAVSADDTAFATALQVAHAAESGSPEDVTEGADSYFAVHTPIPKWATSDRFVKTIGNHAFYRVQLPPARTGAPQILVAGRVRQACEASFAKHQNDCSAFAREVAEQLGVRLEGSANNIVETLRTGEGWATLRDGAAAANSAHSGKLVIAGLHGSEQVHPSEHGHVVVVVDGPMEGRYPHAYWGRLGGNGERDKTINFAWELGDRDRITYAEHDI